MHRVPLAVGYRSALRALWPQAAAHCARAGGRGVLVLGRHGGHEGGRGRWDLGVRAHCNAAMVNAALYKDARQHKDALPLCAAAHPLHTRFTKIIGASILKRQCGRALPVPRAAAAGTARLGFGRIDVSEKEAPIILANLV